MHRSPHSVVHRDLTFLPAASRYRTDLDVLTEASTSLFNMGRPLGKFPRFEWPGGPTRNVPMLPGRLDFHIQSRVTRTKRAAKDPYSFDRMASEKYPVPAPTHLKFVTGNATRLEGRDQVVLMP